MTFTSFFIVAVVGSVDETSEDSRGIAVEVVVFVVVVDSVATAVVVTRGLPHTTLRLPFNPPKIMNTWKKKYLMFFSSKRYQLFHHRNVN